MKRVFECGDRKEEHECGSLHAMYIAKNIANEENEMCYVFVYHEYGRRVDGVAYPDRKDDEK